MVHGGHGGGVAPAEHLRDDPVHAAPELLGARPAHAVEHEADGAALPCGAPEDLVERADEDRVGVRDDELHAVNAAVADLPVKGQPRAVGLGVTVSTPNTRLQPSASQSMAVTTAVEATRPPQRHLTQGADEPSRSLAKSSSLSASRLDVMAFTWPFKSLETPIFSATLCNLRVPVSVAYISSTVVTGARSTRRWRSFTFSGKRLPEHSLEMCSVSVPTQVASDLSR